MRQGRRKAGYVGELGYTLMEFLVAIMIIGILSGAAVSNMKVLEDPLSDASAQTTHFLRLARGQAMARTMFIVLMPASNSRISANSSTACDGALTPMTDLFIDIPTGANLTDTTWSVCFTPRGFSDAHVTFDLSDGGSRSRTIEVALAGGNRVQ